MAKVVCESCGSSFPIERVRNLKNCPVCGASFDEEENMEDSALVVSLWFGDGIELGENESFDEDKIDFWWYEIDEPSEDGAKRGSVYINCTKCGHFVGSMPYPIAQTGNYLLIAPRCQRKCSHCGNEMKNHILSKRPADWVDPRKREMWVKDYKNMPKCPTCSSINIRKISVTSKVASVAMWGVLSRKVYKQWHCDTCGSEW